MEKDIADINMNYYMIIQNSISGISQHRIRATKQVQKFAIWDVNDRLFKDEPLEITFKAKKSNIQNLRFWKPIYQILTVQNTGNQKVFLSSVEIQMDNVE